MKTIKCVLCDRNASFSWPLDKDGPEDRVFIDCDCGARYEVTLDALRTLRDEPEPVLRWLADEARKKGRSGGHILINRDAITAAQLKTKPKPKN